MRLRSFDGKLVVLGILVIAVGGTVLLNVVTAGPPKTLQALLPSPTGSPLPTVEVGPSSPPAEPGTSVEVAVESCGGVVPAVDFDGSFWVPGNGRTMTVVAGRLTPPVDPSSVTLQAPDSALLRTAAGEPVVLVRSPSAKLAFPVCD